MCVHGDDFLSVGSDRDLRWFEGAILRYFDGKVKGKNREVLYLDRALHAAREVPDGLKPDDTQVYQDLIRSLKLGWAKRSLEQVLAQIELWTRGERGAW